MVMDPNTTKKDRDNILEAFGLDPECIYGEEEGQAESGYKNAEWNPSSILERVLQNSGSGYKQSKSYA